MSALLAAVLAAIGMLPERASAYDRRFALLIGLSNYERGANKGYFRDLPLIANDLEEVGKALDALGFDVRIYSDATKPVGSKFDYNPLLLQSDPRTLPVNSTHISNSLARILSMIEHEAKNDLLLVYFTGHGGIFGNAQRVLAVPQSQVDDQDSFYPVRTLLDRLAERAPTADKMLIVDACADRLAPGGQDAVTRPDELLPVYLYSSRLGERSYFDNVLKMSVFTRHFVDALAQADRLGNGNGNGKLESDEIRRFVYDRVPSHRAAREQRRGLPPAVPRAQTPIGSSVRDLVLWEDKPAAAVPHPGASAGAAEEAANIRDLTRTHYGSEI